MRQTVSWLLVVLLGLMMWSKTAATQERDLGYGPDPSQRLDLSVPAGKGFPTVLFIHGGSLTSGDKADDDYRYVCAPFPQAGIACANVNYRLAPAHSWPAQAEDVAAAVAWVRRNIELRGGDPHKLFLMGHSSGATLVALVGTDERYLARQALKTSDLRGPIRHVRAGLPPFLFLIAESEQEQPPVLKTDRKFVEDARALGNWAEYKILPGRTHYSGIRNLSGPGDAVFSIVRDFVRQFSGGGRQ